MTISLAKARADKSGDCRDWSVLDALREALRLVESGELDATMVYVAFQTRVPDEPDTVEYRWQCAGATKLELVGLLTRHANAVMNTER